MEEKIKKLVDPHILELGLFVSAVYYSKEEGLKTLNVELDSKEVIDVNKVTEASKIINPIIDEAGFLLLVANHQIYFSVDNKKIRKSFNYHSDK